MQVEIAIATSAISALVLLNHPSSDDRFGRVAFASTLAATAGTVSNRARVDLPEFEDDHFGRAALVRPVLHHLGVVRKRLVVDNDEQVLVGVDVPAGEERDVVLERLLAQLADVGAALVRLAAAGGGTEPPADERLRARSGARAAYEAAT